MVGLEIEKALGKIGRGIDNTWEVHGTEGTEALVAKAKTSQTFLELVTDDGLVPLRSPSIPTFQTAWTRGDNRNEGKMFPE
jgi:hypothetical protein